MSDHGLLFHVSAGAAVGDLVPNYRTSDEINFGYGVLVTYTFKDKGGEKEVTTSAPNPDDKVPSVEFATKLVCDTIDSLRCAQCSFHPDTSTQGDRCSSHA